MKLNRLAILLIFNLSIFLNVSGQAVTNQFQTHQVFSSLQADSTSIRVLLPDNFDSQKSYKVLYVLPVVENGNSRYGDGLAEVLKYNFHNKYNLICVNPGFSAKPWFVDHSENKNQQDENYFINVVLPFIDKHYPTVKSKEGRLLVGFSKSGRGAFSLLLRNPGLFYKAAGWDSGIRVDVGPIEEKDRDERIKNIFGNKANFEKYKITNLLKENGKQLGETERIFYYNTEGTRGIGGARIHQLMVELEIPHRYLFEPKRKHRWDSGWIPQAIEFLVEAPPNLP